MPARMWLSVQTRVTALVIAIALVAVCELVVSRSSETRRIDTYLAADAKEHAGLLDRTLELEGGSLATFAYDYTYWDEMVRFVQTGDRTWASQNIDEGMGTYRANAAWVFDAAGAPVYVVRDSTLEALLEPLPPGLSVKDAVGDSHFCHFFIAGPDGPVEIRGATIHLSDDVARKTPVRGYFIVARSWNRQYLAELSRLTGKTMRIAPARAGARPSTEIARQSGEITFIRPLPGPQGIPELTFTASLRPGWTAAALSSGPGLFTLQIALALLGVLGLTLVLWLWVTRPMGRIRRSLQTGSTEALKPLEHSRTEFGQLAQLVEQFFGQNAALVKEVTERKQAETELSAEAERTKILFDYAPDAFYLSDFHGTFLDGNRAAEQLLGYQREELIGKSFLKLGLLPMSEVPKAAGLLVRNALGQATGPDELELRRKDGTMVSVEICTHVVTIRGRKVVLGSARDITQRKRTEAALRETEQKYRLVVDNAAEALIVLRDWKVVFANPNASETTGYPHEELLGLAFVDSVHPDDRASVTDRYRQRLAGEDIRGRYVFRFVRRDGYVRHLETSAVGMMWEDRPAVIYFLADVTERKQAEVALRESEEKFRGIFDAARDGLALADVETGRVVTANDAFCNMVGYGREQVMRLSVRDFYPSESPADGKEAYEKQAAGKTSLSTDLPMKHRDGSIFYADVNSTPVSLGGRNLLIGVFRDITERKRAEEDVKLKAALLDASTDSIFLHNPAGKFLYVNEASYRTRGYTKEEFLALNLHGLDVPEYAARIEPRIAEMLRTGEATFESAQFRRDGSVMPVEVHARMLEVDGRKLILSVVRDITERKAVEAERRESELKFRAIFDNASDGMFLVEQESRRFLLANRSCLRMLGYSADEFANLSIADLHPEEDLHFIFEQIERFTKGEQGSRGDIRYKRRDGSTFPADSSPATMTLGDQKCLIIMFRDISERKQAETALLAKEDDLRRSNTELEQFAYVASHDLQEPLRMVSSYTQLLSRRYQGRLDSDADEFIGFAVDGITRMQRMINDLLTYSRVGRRGKEPQPTDSGAALDRALQNLKLTIEDNKGSVTCDPLPVVMADDRQLEQLFQNLVGNAIKYHGDEPPRVHILAELSNGWWTFAIKDNGIGIEPQYYERIFQVFQRLHTRKEYSGTGIGLAVCAKIVERHGGRIWVESEPGKGSTFKFTLPAKGA